MNYLPAILKVKQKEKTQQEGAEIFKTQTFNTREVTARGSFGAYALYYGSTKLYFPNSK